MSRERNDAWTEKRTEVASDVAKNISLEGN